MSIIDSNAPFGKHVLERLEQDTIIWLVTVGADGAPQPSPVWFLWQDERVLIYSKPEAPKIRNIQRHPQVALHFNSDADGGDIVVLLGTATLAEQTPSATQVNAYLAKYAEGIRNLNMDADAFATAYSAAFYITLSKVRGFM